MRDPAKQGSRCFGCRASVKVHGRALWYFSYTRGGWYRVPLCRKCGYNVQRFLDNLREVNA